MLFKLLLLLLGTQVITAQFNPLQAEKLKNSSSLSTKKSILFQLNTVKMERFSVDSKYKVKATVLWTVKNSHVFMVLKSLWPKAQTRILNKDLEQPAGDVFYIFSPSEESHR